MIRPTASTARSRPSTTRRRSQPRADPFPPAVWRLGADGVAVGHVDDADLLGVGGRGQKRRRTARLMTRLAAPGARCLLYCFFAPYAELPRISFSGASRLAQGIEPGEMEELFVADWEIEHLHEFDSQPREAVFLMTRRGGAIDEFRAARIEHPRRHSATPRWSASGSRGAYAHRYELRSRLDGVMPVITRPTEGEAPIIAHVPHASTVIPVDVRVELLLSDDELADELLRLTDHDTDVLFSGLTELGAVAYVNDLSRLVFDPERFLDDSAEPMAPRGQGVVYWQGSRGQLIREASTNVRNRHVRERYRPYHAALDALVAEQLAAAGECLVIDCHSFPTVPLPSELDQTPDRPDICIGTDAHHTPEPLADALEVSFRAEGWRVERDRPYAGTFVPSGCYGRDDRVRSVMIEVRRGLYIDEDTGARSPAFEDVRAATTRAIAAALSAMTPALWSGGPMGP